MIVVEYDEDIIEYVDWIVDIGLGVGEYGGCIVYSGFYDELLCNKDLIIGVYLFGWESIEILVIWCFVDFCC